MAATAAELVLEVAEVVVDEPLNDQTIQRNLYHFHGQRLPNECLRGETKAVRMFIIIFFFIFSSVTPKWAKILKFLFALYIS